MMDTARAICVAAGQHVLEEGEETALGPRDEKEEITGVVHAQARLAANETRRAAYTARKKRAEREGEEFDIEYKQRFRARWMALRFLGLMRVHILAQYLGAEAGTQGGRQGVTRWEETGLVRRARGERGRVATEGDLEFHEALQRVVWHERRDENSVWTRPNGEQRRRVTEDPRDATPPGNPPPPPPPPEPPPSPLSSLRQPETLFP